MNHYKTQMSCLIGVLILILISCKNVPDSSIHLESVDLLTAYNVRNIVPLSHVANKVEYIRLETDKVQMLRDPYIIDVRDSLILYIAFRQIFVFSRNTGKYLYEISRYGKGPDEYIAASRVYEYNEGLFYVYLRDVGGGQKISRRYGIYNVYGDLTNNINLPANVFTGDSVFVLSVFWPINNGSYIGYVNNITGKIPVKLAEFLHNGEIVKFHSNYNMIDSKDFFRPPLDGPSEAIFYQYSDTVCFYEQHTDTIYSITSGKVIPRFHIHMGDLQLPYKLKAKPDHRFNEVLNYFYLLNLRESSRFLFFTVGIDRYRYLAYYDKRLKSTHVCNVIDNLEFYKYPDYYSVRCIGFDNDIDDFMPIGTNQHFFINGRDEFISIIPAIEVRDWFDKNPDKAERLDDKLKGFNNINPEDNPILAIVSLKN